VKSNVKLLAVFWRYQRQGGQQEGVVELPCFGQICLPVHQGYKVFDFYRKVVFKVFDREVKPSVIQGEIEVLKEVSVLGFATSIKKWSVEERWYEEEYTPGTLDSSYTPMDSRALISKFSGELVHHLTGLIRFRQPTTRPAADYVLEISGIGYFGSRSKPTEAVTELPGFQSFVDATVDHLRMEGNRAIFLAFSHGDFVPANMVNTRAGVKMIDWEGAGYRSALFDFYSYFFYRSVSRNVPLGTLMVEVQEALPLFLAELATTEPEVARSVRQGEQVYRWIFYIEMLCRLIEREMSDNNLNILHYVSRYLEAFTRYEELLAGQDA